MNRRQIQCRGCTHADLNVVETVYRPISPLSFYGHIANQLSIWCKKRKSMVRFPYEECKDREERPKVPIDQW